MTIQGTIYLSSDAYSYGNSYRKPGIVVKKHLQDCLSYHGESYNITVSYDDGFDPQDYGCNNLACAWNKFRKNWCPGNSDNSSDFNLMLLNENEVGGDIGGATGPYPNDGCVAAVVRGANYISRHDKRGDRTGDDSSGVESRIRAAVHEVGHNLGIDHNDGLKYEHYYPNYGVYEDRATPMGCPSGGSNHCGTNCVNNRDVWDHYYSDCGGSGIVRH